MALNFSASFAACIAAGLKVPRQFMYCIAQDTGAPYVLYNKDSVEKGMPTSTQSNGQWGPGLPQENGYVAITTQQQQQQQHQQQQHQQQSHQNASSSLTGSSDQSNGNRSLDSARKVESSANIVPSSNAEQQQQSTMTSPEPSPYPQQTSLGFVGAAVSKKRFKDDVSPHLIHKNGQLWPQDIPFPHEKENDGALENGNQCFSPESNVQFPAYYKDAKGMIHGIFGHAGKTFSEIIQHGRNIGMLLYVRCPICQKEFKQKSTLLQHGCIHIESRPYPCAECGKRFRQQSHLTQHLRIHTNEKPFTCIYCGRAFRQRTILNQHLRIHTGEKPYKCIECGKDFRQKAILDQHIRTHSGERPFCCAMPNCRRRFSTETEVKRHIDNHMNLNSNRKKIDKYCSNKSLSMSEMNSVPPVIKPEFYFPHYSAPPVFNPEQAQYSTPPSQQTPVPASDPSPSPGLSPASRPGSDPGISAPGPRGSGPGPGSPITESAPVQTIPNS
ncbi:uncharacterized protein jim isoform X4 [Bemisia tabaci]|uniref:uncharacterized protein jim isoform X4 n=1 Tax=Bemisia tabaci TaxID=7038 RepID=UPI003B282304